jgi:hypothetical protein
MNTYDKGSKRIGTTLVPMAIPIMALEELDHAWQAWQVGNQKGKTKSDKSLWLKAGALVVLVCVMSLPFIIQAATH